MARDLGVPFTDEQPYYFISYNSEDESRVSVYAKVLAAHKVPMWYDNGIEIGSKFEMKIAEKIEYCEAVIMFLSKNIFLKEESYVHKEFELATEYSQKTVYVVMLDAVKPPEVPLRFRAWWTEVTKLQSINAYEFASAEACIQKFLERSDLLHVDGQALLAPQKIIEKIRFANGDVYEGDVQDDLPHGKGKYVTAEGDVYEGDFEKGKRHGQGKFVWKSGNSYEGGYLKNKRHGMGKYVWACGDVYEGAFADGRMHGQGKLVRENGDIYEGEFVKGERTGMGKFVSADAITYEGTFLNGVPVGEGTLTLANGCVYTGDFIAKMAGPALEK